jgi:microsomal epoxide hydrolase
VGGWWQLSAHAAVPYPFFTTSDNVNLHYLEAGGGSLTLVFVPGWTMPGEIWKPQVEFFAKRYRVIVLDPRAQGKSAIPKDGYTLERRARDIHELLNHVKADKVVIVGWSLGVLEVLGLSRLHGHDNIAAFALVDNSIGEDPPPSFDPTFLDRLKKDRAKTTEGFVRKMFRHPPSDSALRKLTQQSLRTPTAAAVALLSYGKPREYWREAVYALDKPVLYAVTPRFAGQAENLKKKKPGAWTQVFEQSGHALFVDEAERFNALLQSFITEAVLR